MSPDVRAEGVEPSSPEGHRDLNPARLPIPPRSRPLSVARDDPEHSRFVVEEDGVVAELLYRVEPGTLIVAHTGVPESISGRGIGGRLMRAAVARAAAEDRAVVPWCPYARKWLREHPDEAATVTIDWASRPRPA